MMTMLRNGKVSTRMATRAHHHPPRRWPITTPSISDKDPGPAPPHERRQRPSTTPWMTTTAQHHPTNSDDNGPLPAPPHQRWTWPSTTPRTSAHEWQQRPTISTYWLPMNDEHGPPRPPTNGEHGPPQPHTNGEHDPPPPPTNGEDGPTPAPTQHTPPHEWWTLPTTSHHLQRRPTSSTHQLWGWPSTTRQWRRQPITTPDERWRQPGTVLCSLC